VQAASVDRSIRRYGLALEYELRPTERLGIVAGALHDWLDGADVDDRAFGVSGGLTFQAAPGTRLRASAAHRFRFPTLRQFYEIATGNLALRTERADLFEVGAEQELGRQATIGLTLYQTNARDFIEREQSTDLFQNAERYRFRGVELVGTLRPIEGAVLRLGYDFLDADNRSPGLEGLTLQYRPRHRVTGLARWASHWGMAAAINLQYLAGQIYQSRRDALVVGDLPDYAVVGVRLEQQFRRFPVAVYGGVDNLFNQAYEESYGFPLARRVAYIGLDVKP
jgi:outer membrane receptor protein involved in Fe transport